MTTSSKEQLTSRAVSPTCRKHSALNPLKSAQNFDFRFPTHKLGSRLRSDFMIFLCQVFSLKTKCKTRGQKSKIHIFPNLGLNSINTFLIFLNNAIMLNNAILCVRNFATNLKNFSKNFDKIAKISAIFGPFSKNLLKRVLFN